MAAAELSCSEFLLSSFSDSDSSAFTLLYVQSCERNGEPERPAHYNSTQNTSGGYNVVVVCG